MSVQPIVLIIGFVWPEPKSSAAGGRMMQLIRLYQSQGYSVTFASPAQDSEFMVDLSEFGVIKENIVLNCRSFDVFIAELNPAIVLFDRFMMEEQFGWRVAENCPLALRVLDTEDLHCLRLARQSAFKEKRDFEIADLLKEEVAKREMASILRCDITLMIATFEMELLQRVFKIDAALLFYLPLLVQKQEMFVADQVPSFEERANFVFIGNFLHEPNWNAVQYLKETIWPLIRKQLPEAQLHVYGAYPSQKVVQLHHEKSGFLILGRAAEAKDVVQKARVVLAPLRFGAGIKGKLLESMQWGTPNVTTSIGAESMHGNMPWNGAINDEPILFAAEAVRIYQDKNYWLNSQDNGFKLVENLYDEVIFAEKFASRMTELIENLEAHRLANFMGALLQHHTLKSTKYMSKWIEAKNS
ncbi:glycosyltransferase [Flavobacterium turcicum]|uniref:Glycosyltransferase n=1 Tax=Flavobacterium turcicum TaxID=2764718 RepID=A0ABR7JHW1_9FLAO|nr:glycosyltransferase [Flavobacterium turcicum]MBC5864088.1 glycosyltransferase [Flavobacterium turcicum]NHL02994.1 glycosyltransferase family 4 protein [Flavobacterium turcicum]